MTGGTGDHSDYFGTGHPNGTSDDWKILLSEFDKDGNMISINVFGGGFDRGNDAGEFIDVTSDGGYIIFSDTDSKGLKGPNNFGSFYSKNTSIRSDSLTRKIFHRFKSCSAHKGFFKNLYIFSLKNFFNFS